ncbi:MAG TPA: hypothetical protein DIU15_00985, partial [Deltaproteobacteria bacterium]|nr:hypothetical protein [Deltaproteobacteria bacterium]
MSPSQTSQRRRPATMPPPSALLLSLLFVLTASCYGLPVTEVLDTAEGDAEGECSDEIDNDGDTYIDCSDAGCISDPDCTGNGGDDDDSAGDDDTAGDDDDTSGDDDDSTGDDDDSAGDDDDSAGDD